MLPLFTLVPMEVAAPKEKAPEAKEVKEVKEDVDLEMVSKYKTIQIPRRPLWDSKRTPEEQDRLERTTFLEWRRFVAK